MSALVASLKFSLTRTKNPLHFPHTYIEPNTKEIIRHVKERVGFQPKKKKSQFSICIYLEDRRTQTVLVTWHCTEHISRLQMRHHNTVLRASNQGFNVSNFEVPNTQYIL